MARPLRVEYPGAYYHVMNRGNQRQTVFRSDADYELFLGKLADFAELYNVQALCYCLMHWPAQEAQVAALRAHIGELGTEAQ